MQSEHIAFNVEEMSCEHCVKTIKERVSRLNGVYEVLVDLEGKRVVVEYDSERLDAETIKGTIEDAGYTVK
ncbi:MAG: heavy-metal-associated domain-containing protein [Clostridiaceae bacterium]|jgi:copper chaperone|nr:copper ion binding protein [Bacillota bacterium]NLI38007.1 heavy-metal-associated domain-containing protein [Clostridiaceae bacterium]